MLRASASHVSTCPPPVLHLCRTSVAHLKSLDTVMLTTGAPHSLLFLCKEGAGRATYLCPCPLFSEIRYFREFELARKSTFETNKKIRIIREIHIFGENNPRLSWNQCFLGIDFILLF